MIPKRAILIVDDEAILLLSIRQELRLAFNGEFVCKTALSAEQGLQEIDELAADGMELVLVISDWLMPGMRGDEFLRRVRELRPAIKLVMMSGHADISEMQSLAEETGLFAFLSKPYKSAKLLEIVRRAVEEK